MRRNVAILVFDDVEVLDFAGPFEVFSVTDELRDASAFNVFTVAPKPGTVRARNGLKVVPDYAIERCPEAQVLVIPGGFGTRALIANPLVLEWIRARSNAAEVTMAEVAWPAMLVGSIVRSVMGNVISSHVFRNAPSTVTI